MRLALALLVITVVLATAGGPRASQTAAGQLAAAVPGARLAIAYSEDSEQATLVRVDPRTLRTVGRRQRLGRLHGFPTLSPDRARLVVADVYGRGSLALVDTRTLRFRWRAELAGPISALAWIGNDRVVAVRGERHPGELHTVRIDRAGGRIARGESIPVPAWVQQSAASRRHLVLLLARPASGDLQPTELAIVDADARVRRVVLDRTRTGWLEDGEVARRSEPGLAVDPRAERAVVVAAGAPVAEIDLRTGDVRYHELRRAVSLVDRLHRWLEPAAEAKGPVAGPVRQAVWLANGLIAVTGSDNHVTPRRFGEPDELTSPAGLELIDPRDWSVRTVNEQTADVAVGAGTLLAWTFPMISVPAALREAGLTAYTLAGEQRYERFRGRAIMDLQVAGRYAYVQLGRDVHVLDLATGTVLTRARLPGWRRLLTP